MWTCSTSKSTSRTIETNFMLFNKHQTKLSNSKFCVFPLRKVTSPNHFLHTHVYQSYPPYTPNPLKMSTPAHALVAYGKALFILLSIFTAFGVFISRAYVFYEAYSLFSMQRSEESWLRVKCKDAEFYSNMRQHTDLCAQVEHRALQWLLLHALNKVFTTTHICGERPCIEYINDLVVRGIAWPAAIILCIFVVTIPSIITSMASRSLWHASDRRARGNMGGLSSHRALIQNAPFYAALQQQQSIPQPAQQWTTIIDTMDGGDGDNCHQEEGIDCYADIDHNRFLPRRRKPQWVQTPNSQNSSLSHLIGEFEP
jgi:hypothetical protein